MQQDTNYILEKYCNRTKSHHDSSWLDRLWKDKKFILYKNDERKITYKDRRGTLRKLFEALTKVVGKKKEKKTKLAFELSFNVSVTITVSTNRPCQSFLNFCHVTNYEKSVDSSEMSTFKLIQFPNLNVTCWKLTKSEFYKNRYMQRYRPATNWILCLCFCCGSTVCHWWRFCLLAVLKLHSCLLLNFYRPRLIKLAKI